MRDSPCGFRPSLLACLEDYWRLMPEYQGVKLEDLEVLRILFGFFPTYRCGPPKTTTQRDWTGVFKCASRA